MSTFTEDFFTYRIPNFERYLSHLVGKKCAALEIGSFEGMCAVWLLDNVLTHPESSLTCVDLAHEFYRDRLIGNLSPYGSKVELIAKPSEQALSELVAIRAKYDFVYVDGLHQYYLPLHDLVLSHELLNPGGIVAIDDVLLISDKFGCATVQRCTSAFLTCYGDYYDVIHSGYQVWLRRK